jgi:hypothetical protein
MRVKEFSSTEELAAFAATLPAVSKSAAIHDTGGLPGGDAEDGGSPARFGRDKKTARNK